MDFLPQWASDLSGWGVVAVGVLMLLSGRGLATRREVDAEKARADKFQHAWELLMKARQEDVDHLAELMENSRTTVRVMEALQDQARRSAGSSEPSGSGGSS